MIPGAAGPRRGRGTPPALHAAAAASARRGRGRLRRSVSFPHAAPRSVRCACLSIAVRLLRSPAVLSSIRLRPPRRPRAQRRALEHPRHLLPRCGARGEGPPRHHWRRVCGRRRRQQARGEEGEDRCCVAIGRRHLEIANGGERHLLRRELHCAKLRIRCAWHEGMGGCS